MSESETAASGSSQAMPPLSSLDHERAESAIRVMIVDDNRMIRHLLRGIVESLPNVQLVGEASNGLEAVETARTSRPQVILMDINMPKMNGLEATRLIHRDSPQVAVIGLSIHDDKELTDSMIQAGAISYVTKGGPTDELYHAIQDAAAPRAH